MDDSLRLRVGASWDEVTRVRDQTEAFLLDHGFTGDVVEALTMVACELTENAVKYGAFGGADGWIDVEMSIRPSELIIEVQSPVATGDDDAVSRLDYAIQWIRGHQDPFEAYVERLHDVSAQPLASTESGLGLVRIAYEGHSILDFYVDDENMLAVSAVYPLDPVHNGERPPLSSGSAAQGARA